MGILIDEDIAHIECVMRPSLCGFEGGPILPAEYWRRRLHRLLDSYHLTKVQLCSIDSLLLQLDRFDAEHRGDSAATFSAFPREPVTRADIDARDGQIVKGTGAKAQRSGASLDAAKVQPRRPRSRPHIGLHVVTPDDHAANKRRRARLPAPLDEGNRWDASISLAVAVHELLADGLAATLNAMSAGHVLLGVHAMRLAQISGFEVWRNGITQQLETKRFDDSFVP